MKMGKNIILLSVTIVILISFVAIATYSYFTASTSLTNKITTNVKMPLRPTFTVSGDRELTLTIDRNLTLKENAYNGNFLEGINYQQVSKTLIVTLTGEPGTTCTYNIYYKDTSSNGSYVYSRTGSGEDFVIYLYIKSPYLENVDYGALLSKSVSEQKITALFGGSTAPFNKAKPKITIPSGSTSINNAISFYIRFYNQNYDQSRLADKTFKGEVYVDDVVCT